MLRFDAPSPWGRGGGVGAGVLGIKYAGRGYANSEGSVQVRASAEERNLI